MRTFTSLFRIERPQGSRTAMKSLLASLRQDTGKSSWLLEPLVSVAPVRHVYVPEAQYTHLVSSMVYNFHPATTVERQVMWRN